MADQASQQPCLGKLLRGHALKIEGYPLRVVALDRKATHRRDWPSKGSLTARCRPNPPTRRMTAKAEFESL